MPPEHSKLDASQAVSGELFEARCDGTRGFEPVDTALNDIAATVLLGIE